MFATSQSLYRMFANDTQPSSNTLMTSRLVPPPSVSPASLSAPTLIGWPSMVVDERYCVPGNHALMASAQGSASSVVSSFGYDSFAASDSPYQSQIFARQLRHTNADEVAIPTLNESRDRSTLMYMQPLVPPPSHMAARHVSNNGASNNGASYAVHHDNNNNVPVIGAPPNPLPLAFASEPSGMVNVGSADPDLFPPDVDTDYICKICQRIPKRPSSPHCCGQISCRECLLKWLLNNPTCPNCRSPCTTNEVLPSPFVGTRLSGMNVRCTNHRGTAPQSSVTLNNRAAAGDSNGGNTTDNGTTTRRSTPTRPGCNRVLMFGREGTRLMEHVAICDYGLVECTDCHEVMLRRDMAAHKPPGHDICTRMPLICDACDITVARGDMDAHIKMRAHRDNATRKLASLGPQMQQLQASLKAHQSLVEEIKQSIIQVTQSHDKMKHEYEKRLEDLEKKNDMKLAEVSAASSAAFVEFHLPKWSEVKDAALFSTASPLRQWSHEWWLKVEKCADRIGLYLCCGEDGIFPISVDYQLMVRKRHSDDAVSASVIFQTEFGKEKAWGLSKFTTIEQLTREGAYVAAEDAITFGCLIYPVRGCQWGRNIRRTILPSAAAPHNPTVHIIPQPLVSNAILVRGS